MLVVDIGATVEPFDEQVVGPVAHRCRERAEQALERRDALTWNR